MPAGEARRTGAFGNAGLRHLLASFLLVVCGGMVPSSSVGQTQTQIQYTYDAAGNVIQVTRSQVVPKPDLTITSYSVGTISAVAGGAYSIPVTFQVSNIGNAEAAGTWTDRGYLSANSTHEDSDEILGGFNTRSTPLAPGTGYSVSTTFTTATTTTAGSYTLFIKADGGAGTGQFAPTGTNIVAESAEGNNTQAIPIVLPAKSPDLAISNVSVGTIAVSQGGVYSLPITFTVTNLGAVTAQPSFFGLAYLSGDGTLDNADQNLGGYALRNTALAAAASYTATQTYSTAAATAPGPYTLFVKIDGHGTSVNTGTNTDGGNVAEANEANNTQALALTLPARPDLVIGNVSVGTITISQAGAYSIPVTFTATNFGELAALPNFFGLAYLSADATLDNADQNLSGYALRNTALGPGASYTATQTFTSTAGTAPGNYTLFAKIDGHGVAVNTGTNTDGGNVAEGNEANNTQALALTLPPKPDLTLGSVSVGTITVNGNGTRNVPVTFTVTNVGGIAAPPNWYVLAYLSTNAVLDNADTNLAGYALRNTALGPGASYSLTQTYTVAASVAAGAYTLFVKVDGRGATIISGTNTDTGFLAESDETNNSVSVAITLP
ncbi:MAG: CARDB domain-containing protein [Burkholderiales bacterium]